MNNSQFSGGSSSSHSSTTVGQLFDKTVDKMMSDKSFKSSMESYKANSWPKGGCQVKDDSAMLDINCNTNYSKGYFMGSLLLLLFLILLNRSFQKKVIKILILSILLYFSINKIKSSTPVI